MFVGRSHYMRWTTLVNRRQHRSITTTNTIITTNLTRINITTNLMRLSITTSTSLRLHNKDRYLSRQRSK